MNRIAYSIAGWIIAILSSYVIIALINSDFTPGNWSDVWQATWLIVTLQMFYFVGIKNVIKKCTKSDDFINSIF